MLPKAAVTGINSAHHTRNGLYFLGNTITLADLQVTAILFPLPVKFCFWLYQIITNVYLSSVGSFGDMSQRSPRGMLQVSPGLPISQPLPPDMADYRLASLAKAR